MSHFLHRLASSMISRAATPKLHPMLGSIYAPAPSGLRADTAGSLGFEAQDLISPTSRDTGFEPAKESKAFSLKSAQGRPSDENELKIQSRPFNSAITDRDSPQAPLHIEMLLPPEKINSGDTRPRARNAPEQDRGIIGAELGFEAERGASEESHSNASLRVNSPQFSEQAPDRPLLKAAKEATATLAGSHRFTNSTRPTGRPASEPDEIHIHIGRVEVAAIPQPGIVRPVPTPPARKAIRLEDYLKRANGRSE